MGSPYTSRVSLLDDSPRRDRDTNLLLSGKNCLGRHVQLRMWSMETVATFVRMHGDEYLQRFLNVSQCLLPWGGPYKQLSYLVLVQFVDTD